jgi:hypothetical protein
VEGSCDPGFAPVRDAFRGNFGGRGEFGGTVCVMVDGRVVVSVTERHRSALCVNNVLHLRIRGFTNRLFLCNTGLLLLASR